MTKRTHRGPIEQGRDTRMRLTLLERRIARRRPVGTSLIEDGAVTTPKLADGAVTTPKIADGAVVPGKIGVQEVTDWNDALEPGYYWGYDAANGPEEAPGEPNLGWTTGYVMKFDQGGPRERTYQVVRECRATNITSEYIRYGSSIIQGAWTRVGGDTGWVDLSGYLNSGISGTFRGRIVGENVDLRISGINLAVASSRITTELFSGIPAEFRPGHTHIGNAWRNGFDGLLVVRSSGSGGVSQRTGTDWSVVSLGNAHYLRG